ncbi:nitrite transporter NirC [Sediminihabitans luteus]|uniref:Nitrite transporter NirC n=1 Tax=Sediminihabitans luteus TaxID=1138585 RepID=A0A2M9CEK8_9CELL|nr:formate/nitrite transporter family protein [Sediminihabitans luteus]PJJ70318.1 nitrite transporter NirC [Sediminihabitans luteus]GII97789.1 nitrite transporter NirC [Sediminihabitans luteus]
MLTIPETVTEQGRAAETKVAGATSPARYLVSAMLAGAYIGVGVVLMLMTAGPFLAAGSPAQPLVAGGVFAVALTLVVFAGAELATSAMMILTQGVLTRATRLGAAVATLALCLVGNLLGSVVFAWAVVQSRVLDGSAGADMLASMLDHKAHEGVGEMFFRGVLCNVLVCVAIWACARLRTEIGKAVVIFWAIFAFIASGFEHVVANMTTFSLGLFLGDGLTTVGDFATNVLWVGLGNLVGGALVVGVGYWFVAGGSRLRAPAAEPLAGAEPVAGAELLAEARPVTGATPRR